MDNDEFWNTDLCASALMYVRAYVCVCACVCVWCVRTRVRVYVCVSIDLLSLYFRRYDRGVIFTHGRSIN